MSTGTGCPKPQAPPNALHAVAHHVIRDHSDQRSAPAVIGSQVESRSDASIAATPAESLTESRFRTIVERSPDLTMIADRERVVAWANAAFDRVLGHPPESLVGADIFSLIHADDLPALAEMIGQLSRVPGVARTLDVRVRAADGSWRWMGASATNLLEDPTVQGLIVSFRDVTEQRVAATALRTAEALYADLFEHARDAVFMADLDANLTSVNPAAQQLTGYCQAELLEMNIFDLIAPEDQARARESLGRRLAGGPNEVVEVQLVARDGRHVFVETDARVVKPDDGPGRMAGIAHDTTERHALDDRLHHQAFHDTLSGLPNRALFFDRLDQAIARSARDDSQVAVMLLDLDGFKSTNDTLGHAAGDDLLVEVAKRLLSVIRAGETVARLGGDEFGVVAEGLAVHCEAAALAERLQSVFDEPFTTGEATQHMTASLGVVVARAGRGVKSGDLLRDADTAMYRAKAGAKGGTEFFAPRLRTELVRRLALSRALETAVRDGELHVQYQPIVSITDNRILALEALARWLHPMWGWVRPDEFIPIAEENGMIPAVGRYVLAAAAPHMAKWRHDHPDALPLGVFVNTSPQELSKPGVVRAVTQTLRANGLSTSDIAFELTERAFINESNRPLTKHLAEFSRIGVQIVLDDFGTGYSALASLQRLPLAALKIDRVFIQAIHSHNDEAPIVDAIVALGKALGMMVIAEGVEHEAQLDYLRRLGCDAAQGFLFARPQHASEVPALLVGGVRRHQG